MKKSEITKAIGKQLKWTREDAEYFVAYILDYIVYEAYRTGEVRINGHIFSRKVYQGRNFVSRLDGKEYTTSDTITVSYKNRRLKFKTKKKIVPHSEVKE